MFWKMALAYLLGGVTVWGSMYLFSKLRKKKTSALEVIARHQLKKQGVSEDEARQKDSAAKRSGGLLKFLGVLIVTSIAGTVAGMTLYRRDLYAQGQSYLDQGMYQMALERLYRLPDDYESVSALAERARIGLLLERGDYQQVMDALDDPGDLRYREAAYQQAIRWMEAGETQAARQLLETIGEDARAGSKLREIALSEVDHWVEQGEWYIAWQNLSALKSQKVEDSQREEIVKAGLLERGLSLYEEGDYSQAKRLLEPVADQQDAQRCLALIQARTTPGKAAVASLLTLKAEAPVLEVLMLDGNLPYFLVGIWSGGGMTLRMDENLGLDINLSSDEPEQPYTGYYILNRELILYTGDEERMEVSVGKFTITGKDALELWLFADAKTYKLKRQGS